MEKPQAASSAPILQTEEGVAYNIPEGGSLGLLALGYSGLMLWREKRAAIKKTQEHTPVKPTKP